MQTVTRPKRRTVVLIRDENGAPVNNDIILNDSGLRVTDLQTVEECVAAYTELTAAVAAIGIQITVAEETGDYDPIWLSRIRSALRWKKAGMSAVLTRRGVLSRADRAAKQLDRDRLLLEEIRAGIPHEQFMQFVANVSARHPEVFKRVYRRR